MIESTVLGFVFPGGLELVIVAVIVLLLFGTRLPGVMRSLGTSIVEFKKGVNDIGDDSSDEQDDDRKRPDS